MAKRQVFFSFHFDNDSWRASQVRNMGKVSGDSTFSDNDWEEVKVKSEKEIKEWINKQLEKRSCLVLLIGAETADRKWINYEIKKAYELDKGIVGIYVHKLKSSDGTQDDKGANPFYYVKSENGQRISKFVKCFDSSYTISTYVYDDIKDNIEDLIEYGIEHKPSTW
jgi:ferredoxin-fold anticodon binding domain-containing protein